MTLRFLRDAGTGRYVATQARKPGDRVAVRVDMLEPGAPYELRAARHVRGLAYASAITAHADGEGVIDTRTAVPIAGSYDGADVDGLFWSMRQCASPDDASSAMRVQLTRDGRVLAEAALSTARAEGEAVPADAGFAGRLFLPDGEAPCPAILTLGGSNGGMDSATETAAAFAAAGYVALALAYFAWPGLPEQLVDVPLGYFARALAWLRRHPRVRGSIAVNGRSRGGELALLLGAQYPEIGAVVAHVPSMHRWCGAGGADSAAWTLDGVALPYLAGLGPPEAEPDAEGRPLWSTRPLFERALARSAAETLEAARSPIERTRGPVLLLGANDDAVWPSAHFVALAQERLAVRAHAGDAGHVYADAGHAATALPGDPTTEGAIFHPVLQAWLKLGGTPTGNARAQRDAWTRTLAFLRERLA